MPLYFAVDVKINSLFFFKLQQLRCQWLKTGQFFLSSMTYNLAWDPQGNVELLMHLFNICS